MALQEYLGKLRALDMGDAANALRGYGDSATLGTVKYLQALAKMPGGGHNINSVQGFRDAYNAELADVEASKRAAKESGAYTLGNLAGIVPQVLATGGLAGVGRAGVGALGTAARGAAAGAGQGAIEGFTQNEGMENVGRDVGLGSTLGGVLGTAGGVLSGGQKAARKFLGKSEELQANVIKNAQNTIDEVGSKVYNDPAFAKIANQQYDDMIAEEVSKRLGRPADLGARTVSARRGVGKQPNTGTKAADTIMLQRVEKELGEQFREQATTNAAMNIALLGKNAGAGVTKQLQKDAKDLTQTQHQLYQDKMRMDAGTYMPDRKAVGTSIKQNTGDFSDVIWQHVTPTLGGALAGYGTGLAFDPENVGRYALGGAAVGGGGKMVFAKNKLMGQLGMAGLGGYASPNLGANVGLTAARALAPPMIDQNAGLFGTRTAPTGAANEDLPPWLRDHSAPAPVQEDVQPVADRPSEQAPVQDKFLAGLALLETADGQKTVKGPKGEDSFNLYNIKDTSGKGFRAHDEAEGSNDAYRVYGSAEEAKADALDLLKRKYPDALNATTPEAFARALKKGGYATDPQHEQKLIAAIRQVASEKASTPKVVPQPDEVPPWQRKYQQ